MNDEQRDELLTDLRLNMLGFSKDLESKAESDEKEFKAVWRAIKQIRERTDPVVKRFEKDSSVASWRSSQMGKWAVIIPVVMTVSGGLCAGGWELLKWVLEH